jgi:hypothetical protein
MLRSDPSSHTVPVLPLRLVPQIDFVTHAANLFFAPDRFRWVTGGSLLERFVDQVVNAGDMRWSAGNAGLPFRVSIAPGRIMWFLQVCLMRTQWLSHSEVFTAMTALVGSSISMQSLSYLKNLTPPCENRPEMISLVPIRVRYRKAKPCLR